MRSLITILLVGVGLSGAAEKIKEHDFQYRDLELHRVVESLAKLQGKSVIFSRGAENKPITVTLNSVTPAFALRLILENYGLIAVNKGEVLHVMTPAERGVATSSPTSLIPLTNAVARDIQDNVRALVGAAGTVAINEQLNALMISAPDEIISKVKRLVTELDQESAQVYIEAKLIESSTTFSRNLGIEWGARGAAGIINRTANGVSLNAPAPNSDTTLLGIAATGQLAARISAGEKNGDLKVISSPKITTLNGTPANIESLTTFSIRTLTAVPGQTTTANGGITSIRAGVRLVVTPYIVSQDQVRLNIQLSKSDPDFSQSVDGIPGISDNTANTSLIVRDGQTAGIGGLIRRSNSNSTNGVPFLASLPIIGMLFGNNERKQDDRELLIFITPSVFRASAPKWGKLEEGSSLTFDGMKPLRAPSDADLTADNETKVMEDVPPAAALPPSGADPALAAPAPAARSAPAPLMPGSSN